MSIQKCEHCGGSIPSEVLEEHKASQGCIVDGVIRKREALGQRPLSTDWVALLQLASQPYEIDYADIVLSDGDMSDALVRKPFVPIDVWRCSRALELAGLSRDIPKVKAGLRAAREKPEFNAALAGLLFVLNIDEERVRVGTSRLRPRLLITLHAALCELLYQYNDQAHEPAPKPKTPKRKRRP